MKKPDFVFTLLALLAFGFASTPAMGAQSRERDSPTPLKTNELKGGLDGTDTEYFYSFVAGPGELTVTFDVKASDTNAGANLDLFDMNSRQMLSLLAQGIDRGSERVSKSIRVGSRQKIIMRLKGISYGTSGNYQGSFLVRLTGPGAPRIEEDDTVKDDRMGLPSGGILRFEMSDGTTQEINLARVRRVYIKP